jgi:hypothetical protein
MLLRCVRAYSCAICAELVCTLQISLSDLVRSNALLVGAVLEVGTLSGESVQRMCARVACNTVCVAAAVVTKDGWLDSLSEKRPTVRDWLSAEAHALAHVGDDELGAGVRVTNNGAVQQ